MAKARDQEADGFSEAERSAMKDRAAEVRRSKKATPAEDLQAVLDKIASMAPADREIAEQVHKLVLEHAPELTPKTWYGMQSYARNGKSVVFFQDAQKFKARYSTLGFNDLAQLDEGSLWATSYAVTEWTPEVEQKIIALVKKAVG